MPKTPKTLQNPTEPEADTETKPEADTETKPEAEAEAEAEDVLPETTSQRTYLSDDGHGPLPDGVVEHPEPVTYHADHVPDPDEAPPVLSTKVVSPPPETPDAGTAGAQTG